MQFAPRLHPFVIEQIWALDDGHKPFAEIWREVSREAVAVGLLGPGYHTVRAVVRAERLRRALRNEALMISLGEATSSAPHVLRMIDHLAAAHRLRRETPEESPRLP